MCSSHCHHIVQNEIYWSSVESSVFSLIFVAVGVSSSDDVKNEMVVLRGLLPLCVEVEG